MKPLLGFGIPFWWNCSIGKFFLFSLFITARIENRIYSVGGNSYDINKSRLKVRTWYGWVESSRNHMTRMILKGALIWNCRRLGEASRFRGNTFKTWSSRDYVTNISMSLKS